MTTFFEDINDVEEVEDPVQLLCRHADPLVADDQAAEGLVNRHGNPHGPALR